MREGIGIIGRVRIPMKSSDLETWRAIGDKFHLVLLRYGKVGMEARSDRHYLIAAVLHRQRVRECPFAGDDSCRKGEIVRIVTPGLSVTHKLHANKGGALLDDRPGKAATKTVNR